MKEEQMKEQNGTFLSNLSTNSLIHRMFYIFLLICIAHFYPRDVPANILRTFGHPQNALQNVSWTSVLYGVVPFYVCFPARISYYCIKREKCSFIYVRESKRAKRERESKNKKPRCLFS